jgi:hypothetical protein
VVDPSIIVDEAVCVGSVSNVVVLSITLLRNGVLSSELNGVL